MHLHQKHDDEKKKNALISYLKQQRRIYKPRIKCKIFWGMRHAVKSCLELVPPLYNGIFIWNYRQVMAQLT